MGLPRTGSSALACLLGEDPHYRSLRTWETVWPCPPPGAVDMSKDTRLAQSEAAMVRRAEMFPRMTAMLPSGSDTPTECQLFMGHEFKSQFFQAYANIPSYADWLNNEADMVPTYRYVKRTLKMLQWRCPRQEWRLKNPSHSLFITAFDTVFPDAHYVMTHRDVASVIPSISDLYLELRSAFSDSVDLHAIAQETIDFCDLGMHRMIAFRDGGNDHRVFDVHFAPFQEDPFPSIEALYSFLGTSLTPEARANMQEWRRSKPLEAQVYARTAPAAFGFDMAELRERFAFYSNRFGVSTGAH